jgi:RHS repeat-associated protein
VPGTFVYTPAVGTVLAAGSQTLSVTFTPTNTTQYNTVTASVPLTVNKAVLTVTASNASRVYGAANPTFTDTLTGFVNGDTSSVVSGAPSLTTTATTTSAPGSYPITSAAGTLSAANYSFTFVNGTLTVTTTTQTISFPAPASPVTYGVYPMALSATASSGLAVTFSVVSGPATISGSTLTITGAGTVVVAANQAGNADYAAAAQVTQSVVVNQATPVITWPTPAAISYGTALSATQLDATASVAGTFAYSPAAGTVLVAGAQTISVIFTPTDSVDYSQATATVILTVTQAQCTSNGYSYQRAITIDHTQVPNTDQTNFPFLFNTADPTLATTTNGGHVTNPNGYDIIFTSDPAGQNILNYEMEEYDPVHGQVVAWVRIPTLSHTSDTVLYVFYGNSSVTASQQNPTGVWDRNYVGVWHVANSGGQLSLADSTSNGNNATNNGATATAGQIDGGMQTNDSTNATIGTPASLTNLVQGNATFSAWVNSVSGNGGAIMSKDSDGSAGWSLNLDGNNNVWFEVGGFSYYLSSSIPTGSNVWSYVTVTLDQSAAQNGQATIYINGSPSGTASGVNGQTGDDSAETAYLANGYFFGPLNGSTDEFRVSNIVRSPDWITTEYNNQSSPSVFYSVSTEDVAINPVSVTLYNSQSQQFTATPLSTCYSYVTWSLSPNGLGTLTSSGLYTAPSSIITQQKVTITATVVGDSTKSGSVNVTLMPPVAVNVTPSSATLYNGSQPQQFTASVINTNNTAVTWTISPAGVGAINVSGLYTAPSSISSRQTVIVTATSQFDTTKSASSTITLIPPALPPSPCGSSGYSYQRAIVIDHTKVPNTDQSNFPFLFNTTDPVFASTANGGHVTNFNGYDIIFTSDPAGKNVLNYEMEEYDPVHGQVVAWVRIPNLSHTTDTILYVFYGNSSIATSQQNRTGVWDSNYMGVWHVANGTVLSLADSTSNGNNATNNGATATAGQIDGGMQTNGSTFATIGTPASLANLAHGNATFSAWVNPSVNTYGGIIMGKGGSSGEGGWSLGLKDNNDLSLMVYDAQGSPVSTIPVGNSWSYVVATMATSSTNASEAQISLFINGSLSGTSTIAIGAVDDSVGTAYLAYNDAGGDFDDEVNGSIIGSEDEFRISNVSRSPNWIAAEYSNQSSPSTFYALSLENTMEVVPAAVNLTFSQSRQFSVPAMGACGTVPAVNWVISPNVGTINSAGLYTAPASISTQQTVMVTATSQVDNSTIGSATITLVPVVIITVTPASVILPGDIQTQQFTANVMNTSNTAATWSINPSWIGTIDQTGLYTAPVWYLYWFYYYQNQVVTITATSQADPTKSATATVLLAPPVSVSVAPSSATLYGGQTQQFTASVANTSNTAVIWTVSPLGVGTITSSGLYTAPAGSSTQQNITITATSVEDPTKSAFATITLMPTVVVSLTPSSAALSAGQTQQFTAIVTNTYNTAVTWTISPANVGAISSSGLYTAPATINTQQTVTIIAISMANQTQSASATVTLTPTQCTSNGYSYQRAITINHIKVPNTDQVNYPFLFNTTDPTLATTTNGGHVTSPNGYDIIFTSDPAGHNILDYEMEEYDPVHGQVIAWVRIPFLSHSTDTILYIFYGNSSIIAPQQNPTGVWDSNYGGVWHLSGNGNLQSFPDSTANANTATVVGSVSAIPGPIGNGIYLNGNSNYIDAGNHPSVLPTHTGTFSTWVNYNAFSYCDYGQLCFNTIMGNGNYWSGNNGTLLSNYGGTLYFDVDGPGGGSGDSVGNFATGQWYYLTGTWDGSTVSLYANGALVASEAQTADASPAYDLTFGVDGAHSILTGYMNGSLDEARVSNNARSADWIAMEYSNQISPSTFFTLYPENAVMVVPTTAKLYASQSQQFTTIGACGATIAWSMPSSAPGALGASGLYTSPTNITTLQIVTVTATNQVSGIALGAGSVTLLPPPFLTLTAAAQPPYTTGSSQGFVVTLTDATRAPLSGVAITFTVAGVNNNTGIITTDSNGIASYAYIGSISGSDTVQATAVVNGQQLTSNSVPVSWISPPPVNAEGSITLSAGPDLGLMGLCGAFTDSNGSVIEPIAIGAAPRVFVVPAGATQFQMGVNDTYYADNGNGGGVGFVVEVNGVIVTVPATAMPWNWAGYGAVERLNINYQFGVNDGTNPVVALTGLTQGQSISVIYKSGTVTTDVNNNPPGFVGANGGQPPTGTSQGLPAGYFPTVYMTASSYPIGQPVPLTAVVTNGSGTPMPNVPVMLNVTGANGRQLQVTTDSTGTAAFSYVGLNAGTDIVEARAFPSGEASLVSGVATVTWTGFTSLPPSGSLTLTPNSVPPLPVGGQQMFTVLATDASGAPVPNVDVTLVIPGNYSSLPSGITDATGYANILYQDVYPGIASVQAVAYFNGMVEYSNVVSVPWTLPPSTTTATGGSGTISISITADTTVTLPNTLQLNGTVTDSAGFTPTITWSQVSGPGNVTFANPNQAVTTAAFSDVGSYMLQLSASDATGNSGSVQWQVTVYPPLQNPQGWIASPAYGSTVTGVVPITLAPGVALQSGTLTYYPANNTKNVTVLNANTTGSGQIGTLDTTMLANGSYWIQLQATNTSGSLEYSLVLVTVAGNYKPGRVTATVTDLVVPATGLAINIQRTYDSLNAGASGDFGYGWNLGINVNLVVDNSGNVTFTLGGQRRTFYLTPQMTGCNVLIGCYFPYYFVAYTPEPGLYGMLTDGGSGCGLDLDILVPDGSIWFCPGGTQFNPTGYIYTDPNGTSYSISASGQLQSIQDRSGNGLTITANGITSTTGLNVPFVRDASNRITQITDPQGNVYLYGYDANGNLATVTYPNTTQPSTYTYDANHLYLSGTDARSNPLPTTAYFGPTDTDPNGLPLNGRLQSVTDAFNNTTSYAYNLATNTTTITYPDHGTATMVYDNYGMLLNSTDPLNHTTTNVYDVNHNLISTTDPLGHTTTATYDSNGNKTSSTYPATATSKNTTSYTYYNQYSEPISTTDELGNVRAFNYDANYNPQSVTDSIGALASFIFNPNQTLAAGAIGFDISANPAMASQFTYDANGNMTSRTDALGRTTSYTYNSLGQKTAMVAPTPTTLTGSSASTTSYQYDALGNLLQTAAPLSRTTSSTYDANGNKISDTDARGNTTTYQYDSLNRLIETDYPDGTKSTRTYDFRNNVVTATDQAGNVTLNAYDLDGRLTSVTRGYGTSSASTTTYAYDDANRKISETDALGHATSYTYDADSRLIALSGVKGNFTYAYDDAGNRISTTDANNNTTQFAYDARKRLIKTIFPDTKTITNVYDTAGNLISTTDQAGNIVQSNYDAASQLQSVVQIDSPNAPNNINFYSYDPLGNLIGMTDERGDKTSNLFDVLSRLITRTLPDGTLTESRQYDTAGNLVSLTHFNGKTTTYVYDTLNRLLTQATPGEPTISFTYTPTGKYLTSTAGDGTVNYGYDSLDRLTTKATPEGTLSYTYYANGSVESIASSNANGVSVILTWDELNRLSTVIDNHLPAGANTAVYTYDPAGNLATTTYPNGFQTTFTYDQLSRMTGMSTPVSSYSYQLGPTGNRISATEGNGRTLTWNYDGIYRLTNESISDDPSKNNGSVSYGLDPVGNRLSEISSLPGINSGSWGYNADDEISSESYDANGNVIAAGGYVMTYDAENHLISKTGNGTVVTMVYDAFGNRVAKTVNGVTTKYLVEDDVNPTGLPQVLEEVQNGVAVRTYTYGLQRISQYQFFDNQWTASFYVYDGAGSVRQLTNSNGTPTDEYEYDAYGNSLTKQGTTPNNYLYRGEQFDPDLGLYYLRARYYNPGTGRFLSRDPKDGKIKIPATLHKYLYVSGNPVNWIDPRGREEIVEVATEESEEDIAATMEAREVTRRLIACYMGIAVTLYYLANEKWWEAAVPALIVYFGCGEFKPGVPPFPGEPPMPPVAPPGPPEPPFPWPPPGTPIN